MWAYPPGGEEVPAHLRPYGRHAACCTKGLHTRRHDRVRDLITKLARQAGLTATTEQAMLIPDQIQADGQPAPGSVRPIHRADIHIIEPQGSELWLDVKIHTVGPDLPVNRELLREEMTKCRAYGQKAGYSLQALDQGMTPGGAGTIWPDGPRGPGHFQPHHQPQATITCPTRYTIFLRQEDRQLRAVGPIVLHAAPSSLASSYRVHAQGGHGRPLRCLGEPAGPPPGRHR